MRAFQFQRAFNSFTHECMDHKLESGSCPCDVGDEMKLTKLNIPVRLLMKKLNIGFYHYLNKKNQIEFLSLQIIFVPLSLPTLTDSFDDGTSMRSN